MTKARDDKGDLLKPGTCLSYFSGLINAIKLKWNGIPTSGNQLLETLDGDASKKVSTSQKNPLRSGVYS